MKDFYYNYCLKFTSNSLSYHPNIHYILEYKLTGKEHRLRNNEDRLLYLFVVYFIRVIFLIKENSVHIFFFFWSIQLLKI
jgi:hypothetical protein